MPRTPFSPKRATANAQTRLDRVVQRAALCRTWALNHRASRGYWIIVVAVWIGSAAISSIGIPRIDPSPQLGPANLQSIGLVSLAIAGGITCQALDDAFCWTLVSSPRHLAWYRLIWVLVVFGCALGLASVATVILPPTLPPFTAYVAVAATWLGVSALLSIDRKSVV